MSAIPGDYARAQRLGHTVGEMLVETTGSIGPALLEVLKGAAEARANKLTHGEYETEATWSTRKYMPFVTQRISVAVQIDGRRRFAWRWGLARRLPSRERRALSRV